MLRPILILLLTLLASSSASAKFRKCNYGGYNFVGHQYSDKFDLKQINNMSACNDPVLQKKAVEIDHEYHANNEKIKKLALAIINDKKCTGVAKIVQHYLDKTIEMEDRIKQKGVDRLDTLKIMEQQKEFDLQVHYVYAGLYNAACSNEDHRQYSIFDLEMINQLLNQKIEPSPVMITQSMNTIQDCTNMMAIGMDELVEFKVSMKDARQEFLFYFDQEIVPDQVILTNQKGKVIHDTGCKENTKKPSPFKLSLNDPKNGDLTVKIVNNCSENGAKGRSNWTLLLKCEKPGAEICKTQLLELVELLKIEVDYLKLILEHYEMERQCFLAIGKEFWEKMLKFGFIDEEVPPSSQGICPVMDTECENMIMEQNKLELLNLNKNLNSKINLELNKSEKILECKKEPGKDASIFEHISWSYCNIGIKKMGL
ncbi:MAG: hypothetical protein WC635_09045 [Bacteriovorax sp.]|jgi:hypothetical protein